MSIPGEGATIEKLEQKIQGSSFDPKTAIEAAAELAIQHWKDAHANMLKWDVELAKAQNALGLQNPDWTEAKILRVSKTDKAYSEYVRAKNLVKRIEELIKVAKKYVDVSRY